MPVSEGVKQIVTSAIDSIKLSSKEINSLTIGKVRLPDGTIGLRFRLSFFNPFQDGWNALLSGEQKTMVEINRINRMAIIASSKRDISPLLHIPTSTKLDRAELKKLVATIIKQWKTICNVTTWSKLIVLPESVSDVQADLDAALAKRNKTRKAT